jgi:hypothetical protein
MANLVWRAGFAGFVIGAIMFAAFMHAQPPSAWQSAPAINPSIQLRGPVPSFPLSCTQTSCTLGPGQISSVTLGPHASNGGTLNWVGGTDSGTLWFAPGLGALPQCFYSLGIQPADIQTITFAGNTCLPLSSLVPGTWTQQVTVSLGVIQPVGPQYVPVPGP